MEIRCAVCGCLVESGTRIEVCEHQACCCAGLPRHRGPSAERGPPMTEPEVAVEVVAAIRGGDLQTLRRLLAEHPGLASRPPFDARAGGELKPGSFTMLSS